jgi:hypothetical protein
VVGCGAVCFAIFMDSRETIVTSEVSQRAADGNLGVRTPPVEWPSFTGPTRDARIVLAAGGRCR